MLRSALFLLVVRTLLWSNGISSLLLTSSAGWWHHAGRSTQTRRQTRISESGHSSNDDDTTTAMTLYPEVAQQFKVVTCSATSCAEKRKLLTMDPYATFSAFWGRSCDIRVEEVSCLGACKKAPCVAIEHDDYEGRVALEGMNEFEFADRVFHRIISDADADRVWEILDNAVRVMAEEPDDE